MALIHPTEALLNPENGLNFISMHFLLKTVKRAKFIFVFSGSDISTKMRYVKKAIKQLLILVKNHGNQNDLSESCGIIINDATRTSEQYLTTLAKMSGE